MTHDNTKQITRATRALEAYEQDAFSAEPSLLQHDALYTEALLTALICDLEHYANQHGINFSAVVSTGRSINAEETADQATYTVGDQVRLTRQSDRCGTIIGWKNLPPNDQTHFLVEVPGVPFAYAESATHLAPAPPFPPTTTSLGRVTHANQAEQTYIRIAARLSTAASSRRALEHDAHRLLEALSSWSGITTTQLRDALTLPPSATVGIASRPQHPNAASADSFRDADDLASAPAEADGTKRAPSSARNSTPAA